MVDHRLAVPVKEEIGIAPNVRIPPKVPLSNKRPGGERPPGRTELVARLNDARQFERRDTA